MTGDEVDVVRLQAFFRAPSKHAAVRSKLVAVVVARLEPKSAEIISAPETPTLVALPNCFPIREDGGNNGQERPE